MRGRTPTRTGRSAGRCWALLGDCQGREAIARQWRNTVLTCRPVNAFGVKHPRPQEYWPAATLELAEAFIVAAERDAA
ncbi:hypothetical protein [Paracoccus spongiarum]|uniref:Uncharacterized protein n=1 Tax=Paracoccus spongiarum TaxID=3064387 RepID=A0ABT9J7Z5_9RHOB|nr:hypothetical protein [Paracoccus sp. 2205BS29-5]MDP5305924.1 hypothetical protein [Paracoccus sp. 2205BS29-5]